MIHSAWFQLLYRISTSAHCCPSVLYSVQTLFNIFPPVDTVAVLQILRKKVQVASVTCDDHRVYKTRQLRMLIPSLLWYNETKQSYRAWNEAIWVSWIRANADRLSDFIISRNGFDLFQIVHNRHNLSFQRLIADLV